MTSCVRALPSPHPPPIVMASPDEASEAIMATNTTRTEIDYHEAEGLHEADAHHLPDPTAFPPVRERAFREWTMVGIGLTALLALLALVVGAFALIDNGGGAATAAAPASSMKGMAMPAASTTT